MNKIGKRILRISDRLSAGAGLAPAVSYSLTMNSDGEVCIKGCKEVLEYSDEYMSLDTGFYLIEITGLNLLVKNFTADETLISGKVENIRFIEC